MSKMGVAGNTVNPSGNVGIGDLLPMVPINSVVSDFKDLNNIFLADQDIDTAPEDDHGLDLGPQQTCDFFGKPRLKRVK
jgi:hypothetical protein